MQKKENESILVGNGVEAYKIAIRKQKLLILISWVLFQHH